MNNTTNSSTPSFGASSLVTDANSALSGAPHMQRSMSINNDSYTRLPASPMSFSSSSIIQQRSLSDQIMRGASASNITNSVIKQEQGINAMHTQKKPRLDPRHDDVLQQQAIHQLLQRQDSLYLQGHQNPQLNAILQQQRFAQQRQQQQQILQSLPHMIQAPMTQQLRPKYQPGQVVPPVRRPTESGLCARRLMQYLYHQRHRPPDNSIVYWRKFVKEYYAPGAKKRWCLSLYDNVGSNALGAFPQSAMDLWQCEVCGSKSGKGFEAAYEVLPRLIQIKFDRGVVDELLFLDIPREYMLSSGLMVLECAKAVQESVYEQLRVIREGQLRITFTPDLKIMSWEFCARRHEEFISRRTLAPQVNQLLQVSHKYQTAVNENGSAGLPVQDLQATCNIFTTAGRQLAKSLELQSFNDLGFSKRYVRCLQISEVVNSTKDLMAFSSENKIGPIESLKCYPRHASAKYQAQKLNNIDQLVTTQSLAADQNALNKTMTTEPVFGSPTTNNLATANNNTYLPRIPPNQNLNAPSNSGAILTNVPSFNGSSAPTPDTTGNEQSAQAIQQILQEIVSESAPNNNSSSSSSSFTEKPDLLQNLQIPDELDQDILREFTKSGIEW